jgi:hypothetical protein
MNELIVREGESASAVYFIIDGTCRVSVRGITLGHLWPRASLSLSAHLY